MPLGVHEPNTRNNNFIGWSVIHGGDIGVFVNPRCRNRGIGGKLSEMIASRTRKKDIICSPWSLAGLRLYANLGEKATKKSFTLYNHRKITDVVGDEILSKAKKSKNITVID